MIKKYDCIIALKDPNTPIRVIEVSKKDILAPELLILLDIHDIDGLRYCHGAGRVPRTNHKELYDELTYKYGTARVEKVFGKFVPTFKFPDTYEEVYGLKDEDPEIQKENDDSVEKAKQILEKAAALEEASKQAEMEALKEQIKETKNKAK